MRADEIREWLGRKTRAKACVNFALAAVYALLGLILLFITFWAVYGVMWYICFSFELDVPGQHLTRLLVSAGVLVLLFIGNATTSRRYLEDLSFTTGTVDKKVFVIPGMGSNINPLAPDSAHSFVKVITSILFSGPRLVTASVRRLKRALRLLRLDLDGCASVLALLLSRPSRVPFGEIVAGVPGLDAVAVFPQMREIDGVMFLTSDPPGLSLSPELADDLLGFQDRGRDVG